VLVRTRERYRKERWVLATSEAIDPNNQLLGYLVELFAGCQVVQFSACEVEPVTILPYLDVSGGKQGGEVLQIVPIATQPGLGCHSGKDSCSAWLWPRGEPFAPCAIQRTVDIPECPTSSSSDVPHGR
jgi:hypothetical protein